MSKPKPDFYGLGLVLLGLGVSELTKNYGWAFIVIGIGSILSGIFRVVSNAVDRRSEDEKQ